MPEKLTDAYCQPGAIEVSRLASLQAYRLRGFIEAYRLIEACLQPGS